MTRDEAEEAFRKLCGVVYRPGLGLDALVDECMYIAEEYGLKRYADGIRDREKLRG